jgi:ABC-type transporter Mla maintaining outer membrane lipid asymmetry ATPase subunit MlaF
MTDALITARNVTPQHIAMPSSAAISLDILAGNIYGFIGPDSIQVSSWLQTLAAIEPPAMGTVQFMGNDTTNLDRESWQTLRHNIAYLNAHSALLSVLSTQENILLPALYHKLATRESLLGNMANLLKQIEFADMANLSKLPAYIDELSYSQAMLVRVVITSPRVIVIDNTLRHFDDRTSRKLLAFIRDYLAQSGASLLLHDDNADFVIRNATKIIYVDNNTLLPFNSQNELQASDNQHVLQYLHELAMN